MFQQLLNMLFGDSPSGHPNRQAFESVAPDVNKETATDNDKISTPERSTDETLEEEMLLLARTHGPLTNGVKIELSLQEALQLFPRQRKRSDAYKGLIKKVKEQFNAELTIGTKRKEYK